MAVISTENFRLSNLVKYELEPSLAYCREVVTANEASETEYVIGTALGKVTADGKFKVSDEAAVDGSETVDALVIEDVTVAAATDTSVLVLKRGPAIVSKDAIVLDASYDDNAKKQAAYDALEALGILVNTTV